MSRHKPKTETLLLPLGGGDEIGASCLYLRVGSTKLLIDCGRRLQGKAKLPSFHWLYERGEVDGLWDLDAVLITHSHLDHVGALPYFAKEAQRVPVFATQATAWLAELILASPGIGECKPKFQMVSPGRPFQIKDVEVTFHPAGHIPGACMIEVRHPTFHGLFTGDFTHFDQHTVPATQLPEGLKVSVLVTETTLARHVRFDSMRAEADRQLVVKRFQDVLTNGGRILVPAMALGRAQELAVMLRESMRRDELPRVPIQLGGHAYVAARQYERIGISVLDGPVQPFPSYGHLLDSPCVVIASSGTLRPGSLSARLASQIIDGPRDAIFFTGHQDEDSLGLPLYSQRFEEQKSLMLDGTSRRVRCRLDSYRLSYHADHLGIVDLVAATRPNDVVLVHGFPNLTNGQPIAPSLHRQFGEDIRVHQSRNGVPLYF